MPRIDLSKLPSALAAGALLLCTLQAADTRLEQAIVSAWERTGIADLQALETEAAEAERSLAAALPNPTLFFEQEQLRGGAQEKAKETQLGISTPLDFLWKRSLKMASAAQKAQWTELRVEREKQAVTEKVALAFCDFQFEREKLRLLDDVMRRLSELQEVAVQSVEAGATPATELQRVKLFIRPYEQALAESNFAFTRSTTQLRQWVGQSKLLSDNERIVAEAPSVGTADAAVNAAMQHHPEMRMHHAMVDWMTAEARLAQRSKLPDAAIELGSARNEAGQDGMFVGVSLEIPIFGGASAEAKLARTELERAALRQNQFKLQFELKVTEAFQRWQSLGEWRQTLTATSKGIELLQSNLATYRSGETSLLEYLDAVEVHYQTSLAVLRTEQDYLRASVVLTQLCALPLPLQITTETHPF